MSKRRAAPLRFTLAALVLAAELFASLFLFCFLAKRLPYFRYAVFAVEVICAGRIINSDDNPEYKVPWLTILLLFPVGFIPYLIFYSRRLTKKQEEMLTRLRLYAPKREAIPSPSDTAELIRRTAASEGYLGTAAEYLTCGSAARKRLTGDLRLAESFIFLEYFIVEEGEFWREVEEILTEKSLHGVEVRLLYDDVGCVRRLPKGLHERLTKKGISVCAHFPIRPNGNNEFNNRTHRKIAVIDGRVGYLGGVNISDECLGGWRHGSFKDTAVRIEGNGVNELCYLFLCGFALGRGEADGNFRKYYRYTEGAARIGYALPFGDGPRPIYRRRVAKTAILGLIAEARRYLYITTPYLVAESEIFTALENAVLRGVDVRIIVPAVPDKRMVYLLTLSGCRRLMEGGVRIFEYSPGFIHSKVYLADGVAAIVGSMNLDYRSLAHNFENGIYFYKHPTVADIERDTMEVLCASAEMKKRKKAGPVSKIIRSLIKVFAPLF